MAFRNELLVDGTVLHSCGLGMSMRSILLALERSGFRIRINGSLGTKHTALFPAEQLGPLKRMLETPVSEQAPLLVRGPLGFGSLPRHIRRQRENRYTIFYTVTEVDRLNATVLEEARCADEIWVPTDFDLAKFRKIQKRSFKINYFTDTARFHSGVVPDAALKARCRGFTFLFCGAGPYRKGLPEACRAYFDAFTDRDDVTFIVLNKDVDADYLYAQAGRNHSLPHIEFIGEYLHESRLPETYACADALLLPSRAEGWSHPAMEFACMGKPAIMTDNGGQLEFLDARGAWLVPVDGMAPDRNMEPLSRQYKGVSFPVLGEGFIRRLSHTLRQAYGNRGLTRAKGLWSLDKAKRCFTPGNTLDAITARLRAINSDIDAGRVPQNPWKEKLLQAGTAHRARR